MKYLFSCIAALLLLAASAAAQDKMPVYECYVLDIDSAEGGYVTLGIARDSLMVYKNRFLLANLDAVKTQCRAEISRLQGKDSGPIPLPGTKVDLALAAPAPDPIPTADDIALAAFQTKVKRARALVGIVPADSSALTQLLSDIEKAIEAHPEYLDSI